ncbi:hypothetical protein [Tolypothrix sp. VBCCA 56010]|uniref:hypothetical protein n=1 Tax=Tolypothrix sp. VBCCA 56010 TaxID=3137731 RepID=UPI003D7D1150
MRYTRRGTALPCPYNPPYNFVPHLSGNRYSNKDARYLEALIQRLRDLSSMTVNEITVINAKRLRCHAIDWDRTTETCFGLPNEEQLVDTPYQFQLSSNEHGRVHGFFIENVFYIVWLDPDHRLYS